MEADKNKLRLESLLHNVQQCWQDKLVEKVRELDDAMRQASDASINMQVQRNMQQIREKNKQIVELT